MKTQLKIALFLMLPAISVAQVPVDEDGNVIAQYEPGADAALLSQAELQDLVGPIALYPDDLLAIVLPAAAYPLQVVEAARFLEAYETDSSLEPSPDWDEAIVALTNYPEIVALLNEDLDWTLSLGEAVVAQQTDVIAAVEAFRDLAYAAGNLKSDEYQTVSQDDGVIHITPLEDDAIYVPYYEPEQVVYYQPEPVYYYYPRARPVYYYPYAAGYNFYNDYFWGVSTAFTIGWISNSLHTHHYSYYGHPYYGHSYWNHWYRRPSISVYNSYYTYNSGRPGHYRSHGDNWRPHEQRREYVRREGYSRSDRHSGGDNGSRNSRQRDISFRERDSNVTPRGDLARNNAQRNRSNSRNSDGSRNRNSSRDNAGNRSRNGSSDNLSARNRNSSRDGARSRSGIDSRGSATTRGRSDDRNTNTRNTRNSRDDVSIARDQATNRQQPASRSADSRRGQQARRQGSEQRVARNQQPATQSSNRLSQRTAATAGPNTRAQNRPQAQASRRQQQMLAPTSSPRRQEARQQAPRSASLPQPRRQTTAAPRQAPQRQSNNKGSSRSQGASRSSDSRSSSRSKRR
jgi:hypothetical protein